MIRTISSITTNYHTHAIVTADDTPGYTVNTYRACVFAAPGEDADGFPLVDFASLDDARHEIEARADADVARSRRERGIIAPFQSAW